MKNAPECDRSDQLAISSEIASTFPSLAHVLLEIYSDEQLISLLKHSFKAHAATAPAAMLARTAEFFSKTAGLDKADLDVPVVLSPDESDRWDEITALL